MLFMMYLTLQRWNISIYFKIFSSILIQKINGRIYNYNKSKNKKLIILIIKFKDIIVNIYINKGLFIKFTII